MEDLIHIILNIWPWNLFIDHLDWSHKIIINHLLIKLGNGQILMIPI
jgi:hypothetical protein